MKMITVESELAKELYRFSYGRLSVQEAEEKAKIIAPKFEAGNQALKHKGINWYTKQVIKAM